MKKTNLMIPEDVIKKINVTEALESHRNYCSYFALGLLSRMTGRDAELYPESAFMTLVTSKEMLPLKDLLDATGLRKGDYLAIFGEDGDSRYLKSDNHALAWMMEHIQRKNLLPRQRAFSELLWKRMRGMVMLEFGFTYYHMTGRWLEDDFRKTEVFHNKTYDVMADELNEAMRLFFLHVYEARIKEDATC